MVSQPGDIYEQEADRVAEQVMRVTNVQENAVSLSTMNDEIISRKCQSCQEEEETEMNINRKANHGTGPKISENVEQHVTNALHARGSPLESTTRNFMESRFGLDFGSIRIHTDEMAARSARSVNALAYTIGNDVVFGGGQYQTNTFDGRRLLAHELTHTIQQNSRTPHLQLKRLTEEEKTQDLQSPRFRNNETLQKAFDNSPPLRFGETDREAVRILQQALVEDLCSPGTDNCAKEIMPISTFGGTKDPDGIYKDETFVTVQKFQIKHRLLDENGNADGRAGRDTLGRLDELFAEPEREKKGRKKRRRKETRARRKKD